eukprot:4969096-Amphidinium_carterae.1
MATAEQVRELVDELQRMPARVVAAEQAASAAATQAAAAQRQEVAQGGHATRLVDTRALGRPREFKSDWSFRFKAFLCGANPDEGAALDAAGIQDQPIALANLPMIEQEISRQIYLALSLQVSGVAVTISTKLQNVESHNGLEAWRQRVL